MGRIIIYPRKIDFEKLKFEAKLKSELSKEQFNIMFDNNKIPLSLEIRKCDYCQSILTENQINCINCGAAK